jgi:pyruvate kinase
MRWYLKTLAEKGKLTVPDVVSRTAVVAAEVLKARYVVTPTETGGTPRRVARYKPDAWVLAFSSRKNTLRRLALSYGVYPFLLDTQGGGNWHVPMIRFLNERGLIARRDHIVICEGGFTPQPAGTDSIEIITISEDMAR